MTLYMFHCGFYPLMDIYEQHKNFFVAGENFHDAERKMLKEIRDLKLRGEEIEYHIDGVIEIDTVQGYKIELKEVPLNSPDFQYDIINGTVMRV